MEQPTARVEIEGPIARAPSPLEIEELLLRIAETARPGEGFTRALSHVIRLLRRCSWLEGDLRMELTAEDESTVIHLHSDQRGGSERVLRAVRIDVPLDEIEEVVHHAPSFFAPLLMRRHPGRLVFTADGAAAEPATDSFPQERPTRKRAPLVLPNDGDFDLDGQASA